MHSPFMKPTLRASIRQWLLREPFVISRRVFTENIALEIVLEMDGARGWGESEPHEYDMRVAEAARDAAAMLGPEVWCHLDPERLNVLMPRSALRAASVASAGSMAWRKALASVAARSGSKSRAA